MPESLNGPDSCGEKTKNVLINAMICMLYEKQAR